jgi:uncharacterized protein (TIGR03067 family)
MNTTRLAVLVLALFCVIARGSSAADTKDDLGKLQGEWSAVSGEMDGEPLPDAYVKNGKRILKDNELTVRFGEYTFLKATVSIDATKEPAEIDYVIKEGPDKGKVRKGIYALDGDTFKSCMGLPDKPRPKTFEGKQGDGQTYSIWKRQKKD